jgi:hypothetical protein
MNLRAGIALCENGYEIFSDVGCAIAAAAKLFCIGLN